MFTSSLVAFYSFHMRLNICSCMIVAGSQYTPSPGNKKNGDKKSRYSKATLKTNKIKENAQKN